MVPCQRILDQLDSTEVCLKYRHLGAERVRALAMGLMVGIFSVLSTVVILSDSSFAKMI